MRDTMAIRRRIAYRLPNSKAYLNRYEVKSFDTIGFGMDYACDGWLGNEE